MDQNGSGGVLDGGTNKVPLGHGLPRAISAGAQIVLEVNTGLTLPCTVQTVVGPSVVTVTFQVSSGEAVLPTLTIPVLKPPYVKYPIKAGDAGLAVSASVGLGAISGLGGAAPSVDGAIGNLGALAFVWLGNASDTFLDPDAVTIEDNLVVGTSALAFFGGEKATKQDVTGALSAVEDPNAKAVLTSLIGALAAYTLIQNGTT